MRTWTLVVSVCAHAVAIAAAIVAPIFATTELPEPRRPLIFESIVPIVPPTIPAASRPQPARQSAAPNPIPVAEPTALPADAPQIERAPPLLDACDACGVIGVPIGDGTVGVDLVAPPPLPAPGRKEPVPVGGLIRPPTRLVYVAPVYPQVALAARVQGTVILQAVIDEKGSVRELRLLRGHPLLDDAAMQAVAKWQFTPTTLNGTAVPVVMTVTVTFTLTT